MDSKMKLTLESRLKDIKIYSGNKAKFLCSVSGLIEEVYWLKDGERITKNQRNKIYVLNGDIILEIHDVHLDDSGLYKCVVKNSRNSTECTCQLKVYNFDDSLPDSFLHPILKTFDIERNEIILYCQVHGRPRVTWLRDDHTVSNNRYISKEEPGGIRKLIIRNPILSDCGKISCFTETETTIESISQNINSDDLKCMMTPAINVNDTNTIILSSRKSCGLSSSPINLQTPVFSTLLHDTSIFEGNDAHLNCLIANKDETDVYWLKDEKPLIGNSRYQTSYRNGIASLIIYQSKLEDTGRYCCCVSNKYGKAYTDCKLNISKYTDEKANSSGFIESIKDTYSLNEHELVLDCRVRGKPKPEITWMKGTDLIVNDSKYRQMDEANGYSKLIISNPTVKDSGIYTCVARNEMSENKITHHVDFKGREHFTLEKAHGFFHRDPNKPHFLAPLGNQTVCQGGTVAITAEFMQSQSPIEVHWLRGRQCIHGQPNVKTFNDRGVYTLAILNAGPEVEGTYTCRASNAFGRIESHATVDVAVGFEKEERPPLFLSRPDTEMKIALGDPFSISFRIAGDPKPKLTFMKGTKDITKSDRISKEVSDDYTRFTVQKSQISDSGTYFVVARNSNGTDRIFVTVTVYRRARSETSSFPRWGQPLESFPEVSYFKDPPGPITTEPLMTDCGTSHLSLSWGKPQTNNSAPVIAYKVDVWTVGHEGGAYWKELGLTPINSFDAFGLKQNLEYHFRVTPRNRYGWGPSVQTNHPLQLGGAESLPEFVKILPGQLKVLLGSKFTLECSVRGVPEPRIAWFKDGMALKWTDRVTVKNVGSNCILSIANVIESDFGRYICEATNPKGRASTFARIQVITDQRLYEADNKLKKIINDDILNERTDCLPLFTMRLRDRRVQMTYPVRLTCRILGYPRPLVTWHKNDQIISQNDNYRITEEDQFYTLEIVSTKLDDSGVYTCTAKNIQGSISCHCSLLVDKGIRAYITPEFDVPLDPVYIFQERQDIRLTAKVAAYPSVAISWHCNGIKLRQSRRILATLDQFGYIELLVKNATIHDAGIYVCTASNAVGNIENCCRVQIEPNDEYYKMHAILPKLDQPYSKEPLFLVKPRSSDALEGDTVILFCEVVGDPKPDVVWLRDFLKPEYYKDEPHFRRIGDGPEYRLEIPDAKLDFTGTYSIIAKNCHGEAKAVISLQIYAKNILTDLPMEEKGTIRHGNVETFPRFIRHLKDMRCCDGDAIMMECEVEALPEPIVIWEKDGHVLPSGKDYIMHYDGTNATLSIPRVYPEDEGEYTCVAKNTLGRALSSACIIVDAPEEKETMLNSRLSHPSGNLSYFSTPRSTPIRCISPMFQHSNATVLTDRLNSSRNKTEQTLSPPKFMSVPHNRVVEEGENVQFYCAVSGHPIPWCTWDKNGMIVTKTTRINVKEVKDLRVLHIEDVTFEDAGLYRITLENDYGRIEATARLDVICRSKHTKSPSNTTISRFSPKRNAYLNRRIMGPSTAIGGRLALAARYRGSSVPSVNIFHNSNELQETDRIKIDVTIDEIRLFINEVTLEDAGLYSCVLKWNQYETLVTSTIVEFRNEVEKFQRQKLQIKQSLPEKIEAKEYDTLDLCFEIECPEDLPYIYQWSKNKQYINDCDEFNYIDHGNGIICLRLNDITESGLYECKVSNLDASLHCSTFVQINVVRDTPSGVEIESAILKPLYPIIATVGSDVVFIGKVFPSNAEVDWFICGRKVPNSNNEAIIENRGTDSTSFDVQSCNLDGLRVLCIRNVNLIHSGEVKLSVFRPGHSSFSPVVCSYTSLIVYPQNIETLKISEIYTCDEQIQIPKHDLPAQIIKKPNNYTALIGSSIQLSITYKGYPTPSIKWFQRTRPIDSSANITIQNSEGISILTIKNITADDSGKYTFKVKNNLSMDEATASVAVEGPPEPPSGKPSVSVGPDRISIAWCGPAYDGGCMITGFIIEMESFLKTEENKDNIENWREIARVIDSLAYTVKNLKENYTYRFRVRAANIHGKSDPSLPSDCVDMCSKDSKRDNKTTLKITSCGDFKNRYEILEEIGKGRFGTVYKVQEKLEPYQILAAKVIKCIKSSDRQKVRDEISIMELLNHPKLLKLAAFFETPREITMLMEYITGGELFERVVADDFTLTELDCRLFIRQVCEGVGYMHDKCVVHLDLKPENIMCHTRTSHEIKIIDFGLAQRITTDASIRVLFGTPEFIAPEVINYEPIDLKSDMWSIGVICYVLLSGLSPFMGDNDIETFGNITNADYDFEDEAFDTVSQEAKDFISNLLVYNKTDRLSAQQCLQSKWLNAKHQAQSVFNNKICTDKLKKFIIRRKWQAMPIMESNNAALYIQQRHQNEDIRLRRVG